MIGFVGAKVMHVTTGIVSFRMRDPIVAEIFCFEHVDWSSRNY